MLAWQWQIQYGGTHAISYVGMPSHVTNPETPTAHARSGDRKRRLRMGAVAIIENFYKYIKQFILR